MLQAIPECWQESWRHATVQLLENPLGDGWPVSVRHAFPLWEVRRAGHTSGFAGSKSVKWFSALASSPTFGSGVLRKPSLAIARLELDASGHSG